MLSLYQIKRLVNPPQTSDPGDDFRVLDSWTEYDEKSSVRPEKRKLEYLCYEMEVMNPDTGEKQHVYKAIKFARVIRLPADAKQSTAFMDMQEKVLASVYENAYNLITVIANVINPKPIGLLYLYGIQGVSDNLEEAKREASRGFNGFIHAMQAKFHVLEMRTLIAEESEWLREKMYNMQYMTVVRGIPFANKSGVDAGNKGMGGQNINPDSQGTLEDIIVGLVKYEYVIEVLSTPVYMDTLEGWQRQSQKQMTEWYSHLQGTKSIGFNLSIPMMYMANASQSQGWNKNYSEATSVTSSQGESFSLTQGQSVGQSLSQSFGRSVGQSSGTSFSNSLSRGTTHTLGTSFGETFGQSANFGHATSQGWSYGQNRGSSWGASANQNVNTSQGASAGQSQTFGQGTSAGQSQTIGQGTSTSQNINRSTGTTAGVNEGISNTLSRGQNTGFNTSTSRNTSVGTSTTASESLTQGQSSGISRTESQGTSYNLGQNQSAGSSHNVGQGSNIGYSQGRSTNVSNSASYGQSNSRGLTVGQNEGYSAGTSYGSSQNTTNSSSFNTSRGMNIGNAYSISHNDSEGDGSSTGRSISVTPMGMGGSANEGTSHNYTTSDGNSVSLNAGESYNESVGGSIGTSYGTNRGASMTHSLGSSTSASSSFSENVSRGESIGYGTSTSLNQGYSANESYGTSNSYGISQGWGANQSTSQAVNMGNSISLGNSVSQGINSSVSSGNSVGSSYGESISGSVGSTQGMSRGISDSMSMGLGTGTNASQSAGFNVGTNASQSEGFNVGTNVSQSNGYGVGQNIGQSEGESYGINGSESFNESIGYSRSQNYGRSESFGTSQTIGQTVGQSVTNSVTDSTTTGTSQSNTLSESTSRGQNYSISNGTSQTMGSGVSGTSTLGTSSSMGLGPSISYNKSYQWMDQGVKDLLELMEFQNERYKLALRGQGAFYTYVYIACPSADALTAAQAAAKATWQNEFALTNPLQVLDLTEREQKHLLYHFAAFSADVSREDVAGVQQYKYCTVLTPDEYVSYTHLPRISEGGVFSIIKDIPKFSVPSGLEGEIYMGTILNPERYDFDNGYHTPYDYRIDESQLMHGFFTGASRSGKTVAAMRFVAELARVRRKKTDKRMRIVVMDPKQDWRGLARYVEPERFRFYSMGNQNLCPIKLNVWKIPYGVTPQIWIDGIIDIYCRAYGLLVRGKLMISKVVYSLYEEEGVIREAQAGPWDAQRKKRVSELSAAVNFTKILERFEEEKEKLIGGGKSGNDTKDAYDRILERFSPFGREFSIEHELYGTSDGLGIDELIGDDDVTVLESFGLENTFKNFIFGAITSGFYKYAIAHERGYLAEDQYETVLVIEEANQVLIGQDKAGSSSEYSLPGESEFEQIIDQSAGYGLFVIAITQKIADMPSSIVANAGLVFAGRLARGEDTGLITRIIGREERIDDRDTIKWMANSPVGQLICKTSRNFDYKDSDPVLVQIAMLNSAEVSDRELLTMEATRKAMAMVS